MRRDVHPPCIITTESDTNQSITPTSAITCNAPIPLSSRGTKEGNGGDSLNTMQHEAHDNPAKKRLFPNETIGAMARSTYQYSVQGQYNIRFNSSFFRARFILSCGLLLILTMQSKQIVDACDYNNIIIII